MLKCDNATMYSAHCCHHSFIEKLQIRHKNTLLEVFNFLVLSFTQKLNTIKKENVNFKRFKTLIYKALYHLEFNIHSFKINYSMRYIICLFSIVYLLMQFTGCVMQNPHKYVAPGYWRATLQLVDDKQEKKEFVPRDRSEKYQIDEVTDSELPFLFEVKYEDEDRFHIDIINGEERIRVKPEDIIVGRNPSTGQDTLIIRFPHYESYIKAIYEERVMEGEWVVETRENYRIPFVARHGENYRFTTLRKTPKIDVNGDWAVIFSEDDDPYTAIGEFEQDGNHLAGTFRTETGDFRFLDGSIQANKMYLSCFDGSHAFLYEAKILEDSTIIGAFWSGKHYKTTWSAKRDPDFRLTSPEELTYLKDGYDKVEFTFPDINGKPVSLNDPKYKDKVKIIQILGTWCPNCADETAFLSEYYNTLKSDDLAIIGLAYEKHRSPEKAKIAIERFIDRFDVQYDVLFANGSSSKQEAAETLPMLNAVISYPTMIFIDKNDKVRKIHTGFEGPATSQYETFKQEFDIFVKKLLNNG